MWIEAKIIWTFEVFLGHSWKKAEQFTLIHIILIRWMQKTVYTYINLDLKCWLYNIVQPTGLSFPLNRLNFKLFNRIEMSIFFAYFDTNNGSSMFYFFNEFFNTLSSRAIHTEQR